MRGIDIFCASQASTSICHSMDQASSSSSSAAANPGGSRLLDRHNPIIGRSFHLPPCTFQNQQHIDPIPYNLLPQNGRKSSSTAKNDHQIKTSKSDSKKNQNKKKKKKKGESGGGGGGDKENRVVSGDVLRKVFGGGELVTPPGSTRYLLGDKGAFVDVLSDFDSIVSLAPPEPPVDDSKSQPIEEKTEEVAEEDSVSDSKSQIEAKKTEEVEDVSVSASTPPPQPPPPPSRSPDQVVVLRVSLHCRGCAAKVKKHISRMQGVRSYNIDFVAKKVTVVGDVTPLEVLSSISKVKNAQLWTPGMPPVVPFTGAAAAAATPTANYSVNQQSRVNSSF